MAAPRGGVFLKLKIQKRWDCLFMLISVSNYIDKYHEFEFGVMHQAAFSETHLSFILVRVRSCVRSCVYPRITRGELRSTRFIKQCNKCSAVQLSCMIFQRSHLLEKAF